MDSICTSSNGHGKLELNLAKDSTSTVSDDTGRKDGHAAQAPAFDAAVGTTREYIGIYDQYA